MIATRFYFLTSLCLFVTWAQAQRNGTDYAFLFYTADYTKGWTDLPETKAALPELATELRENYNFKVEIYGDLTLAALEKRLEEINERNFGPKDQVLFFFTGHGSYKPASDNGYLIPQDGPHHSLSGKGWLSYDKLRTYLGINKAKHILVALDACYSGSFGRGDMGRPESLPWEKDVDCILLKRSSLRYKSRLFFSSGNKEERVPVQSEFLSRWIQCLRSLPKRRQYVVSVDSLKKYINTIESSSPESGYFTGHSNSGDFVFIHKNACSPQEDPLSVADNTDWAIVMKNRDPARIREHVEIYKNCDHNSEAVAILESELIHPIRESEGMSNIQGSVFKMGDTFKSGPNDEKPIHTVTLSNFEMSRREVTFAEFDHYTKAVKKSPARADFGRDDQPVINVSWFDAVSYCNWKSKKRGLNPVYSLADNQKENSWEESEYGMELTGDENVIINLKANGFRLPTEAEWEYVASHGSKSNGKARFGNGRQIIKPSEANFNSLSKYKKKYSKAGVYRERTAAVGSLNSPNNLGVHDLAGNVSEWCSDWYGKDYYFSSNLQKNPLGPSYGTQRVVRGGSWRSHPINCRSTSRQYSDPRVRSRLIGFRLVRTVNK